MLHTSLKPLEECFVVIADIKRVMTNICWDTDVTITSIELSPFHIADFTTFVHDTLIYFKNFPELNIIEYIFNYKKQLYREVDSVINNLRLKKAGGVDNISNDILRNRTLYLSFILCMFHKLWSR